MNIKLPKEAKWSLMHEDEKVFLARTASNLKSGSIILEVGSWCMGSACIMAANNPNITIYALDLYNDDRGSTYMERPVDQYDDNDRMFVALKTEALQGQPRTIENCQAVVDYYKNIVCKANDTMKPLDHLDWIPQLDIYFEDGMHRNPILKSNLDYFSKFLKIGGLLLVHDCYEYEDKRFQDVIDNVDELIASGNFKLVDKIVSLAILEKIK